MSNREQALRSARARNARRFVQGRIWDWLKKQPEPKSPTEIGLALGISRKDVQGVMRKLGLKGAARKEKRGASSYWSAVGQQPEDRRGLSLGTAPNLANGQALWKEALVLANIARGLPHANDTLYRTLAANKVVQKGRERAPAKSVQIPSLGDLASSLLGD